MVTTKEKWTDGECSTHVNKKTANTILVANCRGGADCSVATRGGADCSVASRGGTDCSVGSRGGADCSITSSGRRDGSAVAEAESMENNEIMQNPREL